MKRVVFAVAGVFCMAIGVAGLILPIMPGWIFIFIGLTMTAPKLAGRLKWRLFSKLFKHDLVYFREWLPFKVEAGFTTRHFSLRMQRTEDFLDGSNQQEFLKLFSASKAAVAKILRPVDKLVLLKQVHGDTVAVLEDPALFEKPGVYPQDSADGVITRVPGLTLLVFSADCLSIFYSAGEWIGLAHAGWRGTRSQLASKMLKLISEKAGVPPSEVRVIFGPRIGEKAYDVGEEFCDYFSKKCLKRSGGKLYFDLASENKRQLLQVGAKSRHLTDHGICTIANNDHFYSFRKEGEKAGRIVSFITKY